MYILHFQDVFQSHGTSVGLWNHVAVGKFLEDLQHLISRCRLFVWHGLDWRSLCRLYIGCISYLGSLHRKNWRNTDRSPYREIIAWVMAPLPGCNRGKWRFWDRDRSLENVMSSWWWLAYWVVDPTYPRYLLFAFNVRLVSPCENGRADFWWMLAAVQQIFLQGMNVKWNHKTYNFRKLTYPL